MVYILILKTLFRKHLSKWQKTLFTIIIIILVHVGCYGDFHSKWCETDKFMRCNGLRVKCNILFFYRISQWDILCNSKYFHSLYRDLARISAPLPPRIYGIWMAKFYNSHWLLTPLIHWLVHYNCHSFPPPISLIIIIL